MKALMYRGPKEINYENIPDARLPDSKGAVVKATLCGICGTDLHPYHVYMGACDYCMGHEAIGEVVEIGSEVNGFAVGDRVLLPASIGCGGCSACLAGNVILCQTNASFRAYGQGEPGIPGCQAEAIAVSAADNNLFHLPDDMSDELGIMLTDNIATASFCARLAEVSPGDTVAVIGLGSIGQQCVMIALARGAERVFGIDLLAHRRAAGARFGAHPVEDEDVVGAVMELTGGRGVDAVLDAGGGQATTSLAIELAKRGGRIGAIGVSEQADISFPILGYMFKNIQFRAGVCSVQAEIPHLLEQIASGRLNRKHIEDMVTHRMKLSEGAEAYRLFDERPAGLKKVVMDPTA